MLIGTGSEVSVCVEAAAILKDEGVAARVVSMPSWDLFAAQPQELSRCGAAAERAPLSVEAGVDARMGALRGQRRSASIASVPRLRARRSSTSLGINPAHVAEQGRALLEGSTVMNRSASRSSTSRGRAPGSTTSSGATSRAASWPRWSNDGIRGLTSNPTILQKAISGSPDYDEQFKELAVDDHPVLDDYWALVLQDINGALDVFTPLYEASGGR